MSLNIDLPELLTKTFLKNYEIVKEVIFVDKNPAHIEIVNVKKDGESVKKFIEKKTFQLCTLQKFVTSIDESEIEDIISEKLNNLFLETIETTSDVSVVNYRTKKFFGIIKRTHPENIFDSIKDSDWIIVSTGIFRELSKYPNFQISEDFDTAKINNLTVISFKELSDDVIFLGKNACITAVFSEKVSIESKTNIYEIKVDYYFESNNIRKLILE